jgi:hypothetical protein
MSGFKTWDRVAPSIPSCLGSGTVEGISDGEVLVRWDKLREHVYAHKADELKISLPWLCRLFGHAWGVHGTAMDWETPMHHRLCMRRKCGAEQIVISEACGGLS